MLERRRSARQRSLKAGRIRFHRDWPLVDCTVRNRSVAGACVEMPGEFNITLEFSLILARESETITCRQMWRQGNRIGVAFS